MIFKPTLFSLAISAAICPAEPIANWKVMFTATSGLASSTSGLDTDSPVFGDGSAEDMDGVGVAGRFGTLATPESVTLEVGQTLTVTATVTFTGGVTSGGSAYRFAVLEDGGKFDVPSPDNWAGGWLHLVNTASSGELFRARTDGNYMSNQGDALDLNATKSIPAWEIGVDGGGNSLPDEAYPDGQMAQAAIEKLREFAEEDTRFCLAVGFYKPHLPFNAPKAYWDLYNPATLPAPSPLTTPVGANSATTANSGEINVYTDRSDRAKLRHAYFACVSYVDAQVGKMLAELETLGLADNTVVVLWGDHGFRLNDYGTIGKHTVLERALEAPLIIRPPANYRPEVFAGVPAQGVVETIDIYPTLAELCGLTPPASTVGSSLVPMLRKPFAPGKNHAFSRFGTMTTIRTPDWRLIDINGGDKDLYDLSTFRYEVTDVSASNPSVVSSLGANLNTQGTRPGTTYAEWAGGNPLLADPDGDGDGDGVSNRIEYGAGTNALDSSSRPTGSLAFEDLTGMGLGNHEPVFSFAVATNRNDLTLLPFTSTDLSNWSFEPMEFLDAAGQGSFSTQLRFRLTDANDPTRFFRLGASGTP